MRSVLLRGFTAALLAVSSVGLSACDEADEAEVEGEAELEEGAVVEPEAEGEVQN